MSAPTTSPGFRRILRWQTRRLVLWPTLRLLVLLYLVVGAVLLIASCATPATSEPAYDGPPEPYRSVLEAKDAAPCVWDNELRNTIAAIGADPDLFVVTAEHVDAYGVVLFDEGIARIDPTTPCRFVADTVRHEWLHVLQAQRYGDKAGVYERYGDKATFEKVAECGARMLGSATTPRIDDDYADTPLYVGPCTDADMGEARELIGGAR